MEKRRQQLDEQELILAAEVLHVKPEELKNIVPLKKGMTNNSFLFSCKGKKYIIRIPGEGTDRLIDREKEAAVYGLIREKHICDNVLYIDPDSGYKITEFIENARTCNPLNEQDVQKCMKMLRQFHERRLSVDHTFDIFQMIDFYEALRGNVSSIYSDYNDTKRKVQTLKAFIDSQKKGWVLTHIDAVPENFLIVTKEGGDEDIWLIDWEYAGMQDPHVDIAMFCVYALYDKKQVDRLIHIYFSNECEKSTIIKIYCYIAACGLLWSNWCEYKRTLGIEFGEYARRQYGYAKDYYKIAVEEMEQIREDKNEQG